MASAEEVERAISTLAQRLHDAGPDPDVIPQRTILCVLTDLDTAFWAQLADGRLNGLRQAAPDERADARITARSDDLIALIEGRLGVGSAFFTGRVRIDAPVTDLLLLRKIF